ncbi:MAG: hypothetical protein RI973_950 [Bacteroidota bacterium]|jgi:gliding motility-associated-like protein
METIKISHCLMLALQLVVAALQAQQPFNCDGKLYFATTSSNGNSQLLRISKDSSQLNQPVISTVSNDLGHAVAALGYNVQDQLLYALELDSWHLLQIDAQGTVADLGVPPNLNLDLEYQAGEVRPQGGGLIVIGREPGGSDKALYTINLKPPYYAGLASIVSDEPVRMTDLAFDPVFGSLFGFDELNKRFVKVTVGGNVTSVNYSPQQQIGSLGALFFNQWGQLYGIDDGGGQGESLLLFNKFNGEVVASFPGPAGGFSDGCSCPYRIEFYKTISPAATIPCSDVTVTYTFRNSAGISYGQILLEDLFPDEFTIEEVTDGLPAGGTIQGLGTSLLQVSGLEVLLDTGSFSIRLNIGDAAGIYASQALASNFPIAFGSSILSDDPASPAPGDPSILTVADTGSVIAQLNPKLCPGGTVQLHAAANGTSYLWSNGAETPSILVGEPGQYAVTVSGSCGIYSDTATVVAAAAPLIELGDDRAFPYGQNQSLPYTLNASGNIFFQWETSDGADLSCQFCSNPQLSVREPATVSVTITDENGCTASDELRVKPADEVSVFVPSAFSPNGDGINDLFFPMAKGNIPLALFRIHDRWGGLLFEKKEGLTNDASLGWDGTVEGKVAESGIFFWELHLALPGGRLDRRTGTVLVTGLERD